MSSKRFRHRKISTGGRKLPGLPFMGQRMTCLMCGKVEQSDPKVESQWRCVQANGVDYYVCPAHFPPDATATREQFMAAYVQVLRKIEAVTP